MNGRGFLFTDMTFNHTTRIKRSSQLQDISQSTWTRHPHTYLHNKVCSKKQCVFFLKNFHYFATSPSQALSCCYWLCRNWPQPIRALRENLLQRYVREEWVSVDNEKNLFFPEHPVPQYIINILSAKYQRDLTWFKRSSMRSEERR